MAPSIPPLPGSTRRAHAHGPPADPSTRVEVTVRVRRRPGAALPDAAASLSPLDHDAFGIAYGAAADELEAVMAFAEEHDLEVVEASPARRSVVLSGALGTIARLFGADVRRIEVEGQPCRVRVGALHVPEALSGLVEAVFGFSDHPRARPRLRVPEPTRAGAGAARRTLRPTDLARLYEFPEGYDGSGQCIALLEFGGGYHDEDLDHTFRALGVRRPDVVSVSVGRGRNLPGVSRAADLEVALDLQMAGGAAPGARLAVYFAEWSERGWVDALNAAVHDRVNRPSVISISWGWAELDHRGALAWSEAAIDAVNAALEEAALLGVTVICAAGDDGSSDGLSDGKRHVDFPASSPFVLGCGGSALRLEGGALVEERAWNEGLRAAGGGTTGGGVSEANPLPEWQARAGVPLSPSGRRGRGVPDVAGAAGGAYGFTVRVGGRDVPGVVGTSAVAPLYAGLMARLAQALGRPVGYLNPALYGTLAGRGVSRDIAAGHNGAGGAEGFPATPGWDPCTGWGSLRGARLLEALGGAVVPPAEAPPLPAEPPPRERCPDPRGAPEAIPETG